MVKIAIAGATGQLGHSVLDALVATKKHEITLLIREGKPLPDIPGTRAVHVNYTDGAQLAQALAGIHTVLSFAPADEGPNGANRALADAAVKAGVKRFAPSEWSTNKIEELPWYAPKVQLREYLAELNKDKKVLEYCCFQPGILLDYLAGPYAESPYLGPIETNMDFENRRFLYLEGRPGRYTMTSQRDIDNIVVRAVDYDGEWPTTGGIRGEDVTDVQLIELAAKIRGGPITVTELKEADVRAGEIKSEWVPRTLHPSIPPEMADVASKVILTGLLLSGKTASWVVSDEWNRIFPDYKFETAEELLTRVWAGKP